MVASFEKPHQRPLAEHLDEFEKSTLARGSAPKQVWASRRPGSEGHRRLRIRFIADMSASRVQTFLADFRDELRHRNFRRRRREETAKSASRSSNSRQL